MSDHQDVQWLVSDAAGPHLVAAQQSILEQENILTTTKRLRRDMSPQRAALVLEMVQLRIRARRKFERADRMFFTRRSLEQASGESIARYKALRFKRSERLVDICCGIGGDLLSLANRTTAVGFERDPVLAILAEANLLVEGVSAEVQRGEFPSLDPADFSAFHFDPSRRNHGRKTIGDLLQPSLPSILEWIPSDLPVGIKVAPATPPHRETPERAEREWIGDARECKQQLIWLGGAQHLPGGRTATVVRGERVDQYQAVVDSEKMPQLIAAEVQAFLYEPHPTVLAAGLTDELAGEHGLARLAVNVAYLTGPSPIDQPMLTQFQVVDVLPMEVKKTARELERLNAGPLEIKKRCVSNVYYDAFKRITTKGSEPFVVILSPLGEDSVAIIAKRVQST
ncbi:MAG: class I SAM-dependent methyltransferase [Mariniblastus sp.]|nr:class I SAM-dependent methyltransferase [Mariniblastus sp.]